MAVLLPLSISPNQSRSLGRVLFLVHGMAAVAVLVCELPGYVKVAACIVLSFSLAAAFSSHVVRSGKHAITGLTLHKLPEIELSFGDGSQSTARIDGSSTVVPLFVSLRLKEGRAVRSVLLLPDMMPSESWRHLSILLRTMGVGD